MKAIEMEQAGEIEEAAIAFARAIDEMTSSDELVSFDGGLALFRLGSIRDDQKRCNVAVVVSDWCRGEWGRYFEALDLYERCLKVLDVLFEGGVHEVVTHVLNNMGLVFEDLGRLEEASEVTELALLHKEQLGMGYTGESTMTTVRNLARIWTSLEAYEKVEELVMPRLKILLESLQKSADPQEAVTVAALLHRVGAVRYRQKKYDRAEVAFRKAIEIQEQVRGKYHEETAFSYNDLAAVYHDTDRLDEADDLYGKSLIAFQKIGGELSNYFNVICNIGHLRHMQGRFQDSLEMFEQLMNHFIDANPARVPGTLWAQGVMYEEMGQFEEAEEMYERAMQRMKDEREVDELLKRKLLQHLSIARRRQGRTEEADELASQVGMDAGCASTSEFMRRLLSLSRDKHNATITGDDEEL